MVALAAFIWKAETSRSSLAVRIVAAGAPENHSRLAQESCGSTHQESVVMSRWEQDQEENERPEIEPCM